MEVFPFQCNFLPFCRIIKLVFELILFACKEYDKVVKVGNSIWSWPGGYIIICSHWQMWYEWCQLPRMSTISLWPVCQMQEIITKLNLNQHLIILFLYFSILLAGYSDVDIEIYCICHHNMFCKCFEMKGLVLLRVAGFILIFLFQVFDWILISYCWRLPSNEWVSFEILSLGV